MSAPIDWITRSGIKAKGKRPQHLGDMQSEAMMSMLMAVIAEVSVLRERIDTVERLLDAKGTINREDIENYVPDLETGRDRNRIVREYIARIMRGPQQQMEAMVNPEPTMDEVIRDLGK